MKLYILHHYDLDHEADVSLLGSDDECFDFTMSLSEAATATFSVERRQTGWSILGSDQNRFATMFWTPTGNPSDCVVIARGRMTGLPDDLLASTQTVEFECSPTDIDERLLAFCKANLRDGVDFLFSDTDQESVETYLLGLSATLAVDPVTYDIAVVDDLLGDVVHDLSSTAFISSSSRGTYDPPVRTYRAKLTADWTQQADGTVDIASRVKPFGAPIRTLDAGFADRIDQSLSAAGAEGWSTLGKCETSVSLSRQYGGLTGSTYQSERVRTVTISPQDINSTLDFAIRAVRQDSAVTTVHDVGVTYARYDVSVLKWPLAYTYSQARQDVAYLRLDCSLQNSAVVKDEDEEAIEFSLGDIFVDTSFPVWKSSELYAQGDLVRSGDRYYECVAGHESSEFFDEDRGILTKRRIPDIDPPVYDTTRTYWIRVRDAKVADPASTTKFLSTARGEMAIRHAMMRLRKEARRRLRAWHVNVIVPWNAETLAIGIADSVRVLVPWNTEGAHRGATGKVVGIERRWYGGRCPIVEIEIGIPFGTGGVPQPATEGYVEPGYVDEGHFDGLAETELDLEIDADEPEVPVNAFQLRSPNYAVRNVVVYNEAQVQADGLPDILASGGDVTDVSVRRTTSIRLGLRSLASSSEPLVREIDVVGELLVTPQGIDLT